MFENIKKDIGKEIYKIYFGFNNCYAVFRPEKSEKKSTIFGFQTVDFKEHSYLNKNELLADIAWQMELGKLQIKRKDIISIHINGIVENFKIVAYPEAALSSGIKMFVEREKELDEKILEYIKIMHSQNKVLDILEERIIDIGKIDFSEMMFYAIDKECFYKSIAKDSYRIMTDYSLLKIEKGNIININPYKKPFLQSKNAFYYFEKLKNKEEKIVKLLRYKEELELIREYKQLQKLTA